MGNPRYFGAGWETRTTLGRVGKPPLLNTSPVKFKFANTAFYCCILFLVVVTLIKPRYLERHTNATLAWDVSGYYLYLPALFIYGDIYELKFLPDIIEKYIPSPTADQAYPVSNGRKVMKYSAGMAIQYAPGFFTGHIIAKITGWPADGFSLPYQAAIHWWSVFYAIAGLYFLKKILSRYFDEKTTGWVLVGIVFGTNFLNYATFDAANTHAYLFTLLAFLLWSTIRFYEVFSWKYALGIGVSLGLAALTRPTEIIYMALPLFWGVYGWEGLRSRVFVLKKHFIKILVAALLTGVTGFVQLLYWKCVSGQWLQYSYQEQGFSFLHPHFTDVFFSYRKGWLVYTPLMSLALTGFLFLYKNHKKIFPVIFILFLINTWIITAWDIWWYGGAFGQRAFIQSYILLAFPLAAFFEWVLGTRFKTIKYIVVFIVGGFMALNIFQTYQAHWGPFETEAMTRAYYWRIFGKIKNDPYDRLLLDAKEGYFGKKKNVIPVLKEGFENFSDTVFLSKKFTTSGRWSAYVSGQQEFSPAVYILKTKEMQRGKWLSIHASFYSTKMIWDYWQMPQLVVRFEKNKMPVRERIIRPFRVMHPGQWAQAGMNIRVPEKDFDRVSIFLWNPARNDVELYMDDLVVEVFAN